MAAKDAAEKILEAYNDVFADIVNGLLFEGREVIRPEELEDQAPRSAYKAAGRLRDRTAFTSRSGQTSSMLRLSRWMWPERRKCFHKRREQYPRIRWKTAVMEMMIRL